MDPQTVQLALVAVAACALAIQTIIMITGLVIAARAIRAAKDEMEHYRSSVMPIVLKTREVVQALSPKIDQIADNLQQASGDLTYVVKSLRAQTEDIKVAADDIIDRTRRQASRVDGMMTSIFDRVEHAGVFVSDAVARPMRQLSGLIASVRAAVETLRDPETGHSHPPRHVPARYPDGEHLDPRPTGTSTNPYRS